jgi:peptide/nickel transport system substrate-binding protein
VAIINESKKRKFSRGFRKRRKNAVELGQQADQHIEELLIRRFDSLISVRRFILLWVALFMLLYFCAALQLRSLSAYYQVLKPVPGGLYNEGLVGTFTNANPIYSTGLVDTAISRLVFSGLFKYDNNNQLTGDLAQSYDLAPSQTRYVIHLKHNIKWHDGKPFTADDVLFTYGLIQNIEAQSPLFPSWQGIKISRQDAYTVNFDLPNVLSSFPYSLTNGIIPQHLLKTTPAAQMRSSLFNTNPVGTGPFQWRFIQIIGGSINDREQRISLAAYDKYWSGRPKLDGISIISYNTEGQLESAFKKKQLNAMSGLDAVPDDIAKDSNVQVYNTPLTSEVMAFFNNSNPVLADVNVRKALVAAVDQKKIVGLLHYPPKLIDGPLLKDQIGYDPAITQIDFAQSSANEILDKAGWVKDADGMRSKNGKPLSLILTSQNTPNYMQVASFLQQQWSQVGVKISVQDQPTADLQSEKIGSHDYDILLYGIEVGVDPDVFAYWDSSQASISAPGHLNLSEYKSKVADQALEGARTRVDPAQRAAKYKAFLTAWVQEAPALALYQPNFLYITNGPVSGFSRKAVNSSADRFYNVSNWMFRQSRQSI